ncbi:unnamed protein product [Phytomonas sp. Hart1]|nr:unnamed protein product [Phytomonas sp. Hart1]|eukprot:CCW70387.1 unnamed protein product [Phytomonas sp. isolate Hart1]
MSWTVHEDEYKTTEPSIREILHEVFEEVDQCKVSTGKYTKSLQVFSSHTEHGSPSGEKLEISGSWPYFHTPATSPVVSTKFANLPLPTQIPYTPHPSISNSLLDLNPNGATERDTFSAHSTRSRGPLPSLLESLNPMDPRKAPGRSLNSETPPHDSISLSYGDRLSSSMGMKGQAPAGEGTMSLMTVEGIRGKVYETAKDQHGCRFLQRWLDTNSDAEFVQVIMQEIIPHVAELMADQYANFLVQKLFDIMPNDIRYSVALKAAPKISLIALTPHGTFSVQKMIETISTREEMEIVREALRNDVVRLIKNAHGNHVIQKVLQRFNYEDKDFIYKAVALDCASIAKNKQGCCVLQRCLEFASPTQKSDLVNHILSCCLQIARDPFGNYVLQYVLQANDSNINDTIAVAFLPQLIHLCINKFSSNVMEKVLRGASQPIQEMYINTMCNPEVVTRLIQDDFGNYVLQTALTISSPAQVANLVLIIRPLMHLIKNAPYAKKLEGKMDIVLRKSGIYHRLNYADCMTSQICSTNEKFGHINYNKYGFRSEIRPTSWTKS